jgi:tetratricopeptide (TPR) repeat protein
MTKAKNAEEYIARNKEMIQQNPDCGTSHYNLAVALIGQKKYDEAEQELHAAIECSSNLAEAYVQLGGLCLRRGDLEGCLAYNKDSTKVRAAFSEGHGNIGFVYLQMGKIDDAIDSLKKAIRYNAKFLQAYTTLANAYLMKGLVKESIEASLKALEIEPAFPVAHNNLAVAYIEDKQYDKAVKHCDKAVELGYDVAPEVSEILKEHR